MHDAASGGGDAAGLTPIDEHRTTMHRPRSGLRVLPVVALVLIGLASSVLTSWIQALLHGDPTAEGHAASARFIFTNGGGQTATGFRWQLRQARTGVRCALASRWRPDEESQPAEAPGWVYLTDSFAGVYTFGYGFPWTSMRSVVFAGSGMAFTTQVQPLWRLTIAGRKVALPVFPAWRGLLLNTSLYAFAALLVACALSRARRSYRRRRGQCRACGYDLVGIVSNICPECGALSS
jgi:hypothetical protein